MARMQTCEWRCVTSASHGTIQSVRIYAPQFLQRTTPRLGFVLVVNNYFYDIHTYYTPCTLFISRFFYVDFLHIQYLFTLIITLSILLYTFYIIGPHQ